MRDNLSIKVRRVLAQRVALRCSNPDWRATTSGPTISPSKALDVGVGAHITAASEGGPRYNPALSAEQRSGIENAIWLCQTCAKLVDNDSAHFTEHLLRDWKRSAEKEALALVGKTKGSKRHAGSATNRAAAEIRRNLDLRDKLHREFLRPVDDLRRLGWKAKPYEKFAVREVIIRSLGDTKYPTVDANPVGRMSSWVKAEVYDFYHNGLVVILRLEEGLLDREGNWGVLDWRSNRQNPDPTRYRPIKVWHLGRIPWRNIRVVDLEGDEYYRSPHLFCSFEDEGMPYEDFVFAICGEDGDYDWPLDETKRFAFDK